MKFGRIALPSPDGKVARLVAVEPEKAASSTWPAPQR